MSPTPDSMAVRAIPIHDGPIAEAYARAREQSEPRFVPASWYADDRGASLMNLMQGVLCPEGQINYSVQYPGVVKAWHRHRKQTDFWLCLHGHLKVGVLRADDRAAWMMVVGEKRPGVVVIPPPLWHGAATVGPAPAGLLYFVTRAYDPNDPDEERTAPDALGAFPWQVQHR